MRATGNTILITGAGTGMGLEAARRFHGRGDRVLMVARHAGRLRGEAEKLPGAVALACDISDDAAVTGLVEQVRTDHSDLNAVFLVHCGHKASPASVIDALLDGLAGDEDELQVGASAHIYQELRRSSAAALAAVNAATGG